MNQATRSPTPTLRTQVGIVLIGRNEGDRLLRCLDSIVGQVETIVYVDSGSSDGSCAAAAARGVQVVELDRRRPFSAARARNAGFRWISQHHPEVAYIQFIDGDCEVVTGWLEAAAAELNQDAGITAVCGWRRERYPERSVFNRICDVEWHWGNVGEVGQFGGDVMIRANMLQAVNGYNDNVIAAEDDELGLRLRQLGGQLMRIDYDSTIHDANITKISQWWNRAKRCGYAYALVSSIHGAPPERKFVKEVRRTMLWGAIVPLSSILLAIPSQGLSLLLLLRYPLVMGRTILYTRERDFGWADSIAWGISCGLSSFPEVLGIIKFHRNQQRQQQHQIIEYKG
ncbi:glycosyltransferase family 2 protein [filamentous cyanobacterium LEGE 11480]|uniref:Glycosyltransferase family 2 protein n=2 Tax=Romeriopsis TaxID=2992131 RepID=A0A928VUP9_9CYAN|nr:glycosyltransferase family 2 protein [Romeriopsis navalis LEGE 11480]